MLRAALASVLVLLLATVLCLALAIATAPVSAAATTDIKGKVTSGSVGVSGITVTGYAYDSSSASWYQSGDPVKTLGDGSYDLVMSYAGQFRVGFSDATKTYATRYYSASGGSTELNSAATVTAPTTGINVSLLKAGRITGTVTGTGGATLGNVQITAYQQTSTGWRFATYAYTGADGTYAVAGLQAGSYRLAFHDDTNHFADEYYDNVATLATAAAIAVTSGVDTTGKDAQLAADSHITGTVSTGSTTPLPHIAVQAYAYDAAQGDWDSVGYATTDASGRYDVTGFGPGTYRIGFADPAGTYAPEFYDDVATLDAASDIPVGAQPTSGIDASLGAAAHLTGSLTGVSGTALTGEVVTAYSRSADGSGWTSAATGRAGADGHFDVGGLGPGTYRVGFRDDNGKYAAEFYSDQLDVATAGDVTVAAGQTQSITEKLELGSHLTGTVTDASHAAIGRVVVTAYRFDTTQGSWAATAYATTTSQGSYDLSGLAAGDYRLGFDGGSSYVAEYWNDRPSLATATSITVDGSTTVSGKDAVLTAAASVTGTVAAGGGPLSGAYVEARGVDASGQPSDVYGFANTGGTGAFTIGGLAPGRYKVLFQDTTGRYLTQYYSAKTSFAAADAISLTTGQRMSGVNAQLVDGAHVTGTMTNASGQALTTGEVTAYAYDTTRQAWLPAAYAFATSTGSYDLAGLAADTYRLKFTDRQGGYAAEYWSDKATLSAADGIVVAAGATVTGKSAQLAPAGRVTGTVTAATGGAGLDGVEIDAYQLNPATSTYEYVDETSTNANGGYSLRGLGAGTYRIGFSDYADSSYAEQFWKAAVDIERGTDVTVSAGAATTKVNAALAAGGTITGHVQTSDATPKPVAANVEVFRQNTKGAFVGYASTDSSASSGVYTVPGLPTGTYRVEFEPYDDTLVAEYYDNATVAADATALTVSSSGQSLTADASLAPAVAARTAPTMASTPQVGQSVAATNGGWSTAPDAYDYQWYLDRAPIGSATSAAYTPVPSDVGHLLTVQVTARKDGYRSATQSSAGATVIAGVLTPRDAPAITGTAQVGQQLAVTPATWSPSAGSVSYQWYAAGAVLAGATAQTYTPTTTDIGKVLTVQATATAPGYQPATQTSAATGKVLGTFTSTPQPTITGTAQVGQALTAVPGSWSPGQDSFSFQWSVGGATVGAATSSSTYTPVAADIGKAVTVQVTGIKAGYASATSPVSAATANVLGTIQPGAAPTISGTPTVGTAVTASAGTWTPTDAAAAYQWLLDGQPVPGATTDTYTPAAGDVNAKLSVQVTLTKAGYQTVTRTSTSSTVVLGTIQNLTAPVVTGAPQVGQVLVTSAGTWNPSDVTATYAWSVGGQPTGVTTSSYVPTPSDVGKVVTVAVTVTRTGYLGASASSAQTAAVQPGAISNTNAPSVSGTPQVGQALTASGGAWSPDDVTLTYAWLVNGAATGATGTTYVPTSADTGKSVSVAVTASRAGYADRLATSVGSAAVAAAPVPPPSGPTTVTNTGRPTISGKPARGQTLKASPGTWSPSGVTLSYQWLANGKAITGAVSASLRLTASEVGKKIVVAVTASSPGLTSATATSSSTGAVKAAARSHPPKHHHHAGHHRPPSARLERV